MNKIIVSLFAMSALILMIGCAPAKSEFSIQASYLYNLRIESMDGIEIGVPSPGLAKDQVDSVLYNYIVENKMGGVISIATFAENQYDLEQNLYKSIKGIFDSMSKKISDVDLGAVLAPCESYYGGKSRIVYEVSRYGADVAIIRDTITEMRINFFPAAQTQWRLTSDPSEQSSVLTYTFGIDHKVVLALHSGATVESSCVVNKDNGEVSVAAAGSVPAHVLTFVNSTDGDPQCVSSIGKLVYILR